MKKIISNAQKTADVSTKSSKDKIVVKFLQYKGIVIAEVQNTPLCLIGRGEIIRDGEYAIESQSFIEFKDNVLYLNGKADIGVMAYDIAHYNSPQMAEAAINKFTELIEMANNSIEVQRERVDDDWDNFKVTVSK